MIWLQTKKNSLDKTGELHHSWNRSVKQKILLKLEKPGLDQENQQSILSLIQCKTIKDVKSGMILPESSITSLILDVLWYWSKRKWFGSHLAAKAGFVAMWTKLWLHQHVEVKVTGSMKTKTNSIDDDIIRA
jgi:hypothetical protein